MAARKSHHYLAVTDTLNAVAAAAANDQFELDEADVFWSTNDVIVPPETKKQAHYSPLSARKPLRKSADVDRFPVGPKSLPVKIIGGGRAAEEDHDERNDKIPPHEYLARIRGESLSVHEGVGRTLKGRDLRRVRNDIWKQIGFED